MFTDGRKIFRFDTFGSEAFWGDALPLHKAIAGEKNGGIGPGVSPKTALSVGLKVDADALPANLVAQINGFPGAGRPDCVSRAGRGTHGTGPCRSASSRRIDFDLGTHRIRSGSLVLDGGGRSE